MIKNEYFKPAIEWAQRRGFYNIRANYEDFDKPIQFSQDSEDKPFTPDITGYKSENKHYIEIATKSENASRTVSKWNLLSTLARMKGGTLYLLAPKGHKAFAERIIKKHRLRAQVVDLNVS